MPLQSRTAAAGDEKAVLVPTSASLDDILQLGEDLLSGPSGAEGGPGAGTQQGSPEDWDEHSVLRLAKYILSKV